MAEPVVEERAAAKVNLDLHVLGRREDGYHELDSLVVFGPVADRLTFAPAAELELELRGPFAATVPHGEANLVLRAARDLAAWTGTERGARIVLEKNLPPSAGLGGGSADAAATLRGLRRLWGLELDLVQLLELAASLGADVPVCLYGRTARMRGRGERIDPVRNLPDLPLLLVNPGVELPTATVFEALRGRTGERGRPPLPAAATLPLFAAWLERGRNDLEAAACELQPVIVDVLTRIRGAPDCLVARMSGSGATCWGLFARPAAAAAAAEALTADRPGWWIVHGTVESRP